MYIGMDISISYTSSLVQASTGQVPTSGSSYLLQGTDWAMLKHSKKYWLSMEALSQSLVTVVPFLTKAGMELLFLFSILPVFHTDWNSWRIDPWPSESPLWFCFFAACSVQKLTGFHFALHAKRNHFFSWSLSSNFWSSMETSFWKWFLWDAHLHNFRKLIVSQLVMDSLASPVSTKSQSCSVINFILAKSAWAYFQIILFPCLLTVGLLVLCHFIFTSSPKCPWLLSVRGGNDFTLLQQRGVGN